MIEQAKKFIADESGLSTDWIVLTVSVFCLGCLAVATASDGTFGLADRVSTSTSQSPIGTAPNNSEQQEFLDN